MFTMPAKTIFVALLLLCFAAPSPASLDTPAGIGEFAPLLDYLASRKLEEPLVHLADPVDAFDAKRHQENVAHLNQDQQLLTQVQNRLNGASISWKLAGSSRRLLAVPEQRSIYAELFERYCRQAVAHTLARTDLPDPYRTIVTFDHPAALDAGTTASQGVAAFLVHNIADEYVEEFLFFDQEAQGATIKITLSNRVFSGKIGSYTSRLTLGENGAFDWVHEPHTVWQNSAKDPLNVLVAPVEETLHIALRLATTEAIEARLKRTAPRTLDDVQRVVDEWMAVEEAVVGGLVALIMPEIFDRFLAVSLDGMLARSLADREHLSQYRYLQEGIRVVGRLGLLPTVALYQAQPRLFKQLLCPDGELQTPHPPAQTSVEMEKRAGGWEPSS